MKFRKLAVGQTENLIGPELRSFEVQFFFYYRCAVSQPEWIV
jgi:hypothetical protein